MKLTSNKVLPGLIAVVVVALVCLLHSLKLEFIERQEALTYDWRVRQAFKSPPPSATNLAGVFITDDTLKWLNKNYGYVWPIPRQIYGQVAAELAAQGATAVGFDILFRERAPDDEFTSFLSPDGKKMASDAYFADVLRNSSNTVLASMGETVNGIWQPLLPHALFRTNAMAIGHINSNKDSDGLLRRALAFYDDPVHGRIWHMGIVLAARSLQMDLSKATVRRNHIFLPSEIGAHRKIPIDVEGYFFIDWQLPWQEDEKVPHFWLEDILQQYRWRLQGEKDLADPLKGKLVVVGSVGSGNNISDLGPTPLNKETYLVSKHWNVANSIMTGRFIHRTTPLVEYFLIILLGAIAAFLTWELRSMIAFAWVAVVFVVYLSIVTLLYVRTRLWVPVILPGVGALLMTHLCIVTYRVVFEQNERRRVRSVFSRIVSPDVVTELLNAETLSIGGARREMTIFFADVRGFTEMTDLNQVRAEEYVRENKLSPSEAEKYLDGQARQTLETVNLYLSTISEVIKLHKGTLDKYIGDCVMAFWGAPIPNERHALCCLRAGIDAQRAIYQLNQERFAENKKREKENEQRLATGQPSLDMLPLLSLGSGINTGMVIVGLMGSDAHIINYTVFGREVNLASRLEGVSGRGRIIIGETTYQNILRDDPELAKTCVSLPAVMVKGIKNAVQIYEVLWKPASGPTVTSDTALRRAKALAQAQPAPAS